MARRKRLEPILLEDLENNPCASGLDKVLRFEVPAIRDLPAPAAGSPAVVSTPVDEAAGPTASPVVLTGFITPDPVKPAGAEPTPVKTSSLLTPVETGALESTPVDISVLPPAPEPRLYLARTRKRLFRPLRAEDAHTDGETRLYQFMWDSGREHAPGVRVHTGSMTSLAKALGRDDRNTRPVVESLIRKLSIAIAREQDFRTGHPRMYFVFEPAQIGARRRKAGLDWAVKNKGIRLLSAAEAAALAVADQATAPVDSELGDFTPVIEAGVFPPR